MKQFFYDLMEANPVIAAAKDVEGLELACALEEVQVVFLLFGDVCSLPELTRRVAETGKAAIVHLDLVAGLAPREEAVDYVRTKTSASGIISTKPALVRYGSSLGMLTVLRVFLLDSMALRNLDKQIALARPDFIEILPGMMPKVIRRITERIHTPVIAGGLIEDRTDVMAALDAGALCVSTSARQVWEM